LATTPLSRREGNANRERTGQDQAQIEGAMAYGLNRKREKKIKEEKV